jgi:hypothetical protein
MTRNKAVNFIFGGLFLGFGITAYLCMLAGLFFLPHLFVVSFWHSFAGWCFLAFPAVVGLFGSYLIRQARKAA